VVSAAGTPVQVVSGPGGDVFWVDLGGSVHRLIYDGANHPPTAVLDATPTTGPAPLTVSFSGTGSTDLDGEALTYAWDLDGDGAYDDSTSATATRTYTANGTVRARLRVTDPHGATGTAEVTITVGVAPGAPTPVIDTPSAGLRWTVGQQISFSGHATDPQDGTLPASRLSWSLVLQHCPSNCHQHPLQDFSGVASGSFPAPDHEYPSWLELRLTATDSGGLSTTTSLRLDPQTVGLTAASTPSGLRLALGTESVTTPATRPVIVGSSNSVGAPLTQSSSTGLYDFVSWSDGGAASHNVVVGSSPVTVTATYARVTVGCTTEPTRYARIPAPGPPAAGRLADGRIAYAATGSDRRVYLARADIAGAPPAYGPLECLGGGVTDAPAVAGGAAPAVYARVPDGRVYSRPLTGGVWAPLPIGGSTTNGPAAVVTADGTTHLVVRGGNGAVYYAARTGAGQWSAWRSLGGAVLGAPTVAARPGGGVLVAARATNGQVYARGGSGTSWTPWAGLGLATATSPSAADGFAAGRLDLFAVHSGGGLFQNAYVAGAWTGWQRLDTVAAPASRIAAGATSGRLIVHVTAGTTTYRQYTGAWSGYAPAPYTCSTCRPPG
ncbi:MAG TPA: PKD domain-containing protein, partial [Mycobacteriales bacterium]